MSRLIVFFTAIALSSAAFAGAASAQNSDAIVSALVPKKPAAGDAFHGGGTRGIVITGEIPPEPVRPSIDLTINFEFDSDKLTNDGWITMQALGEALQDPRLDGMDFMVAGHTDGRGEAAYNEDLSLRRAMTVVRHLRDYYSIDANRLQPIGYGESQLIDQNDPANAINRRVEIINMAPLS